MGCLVLLFAFISPRLALFATWLFTSLLDRPFDSWLVPIAGFFLLPWTTLAYVWMWDSHRQGRRARMVPSASRSRDRRVRPSGSD